MQLFILLIPICEIVNWIQWFPDIYCFTWLKIVILLIVCQTNNQAGLPSLKNISRQIWHENPSFWDQKKLDIWSNNNFVLLYSMREEVQGSREMVGVEALHMLIKNDITLLLSFIFKNYKTSKRQTDSNIAITYFQI